MKSVLHNCKLYNCKQRPTCTIKDNPWKDGKAICRTLNNYINQDQVSQKEKPFSYINFDINLVSTEKEAFPPVKDSKNSLIFKLYFLDRKSVKEISIMLDTPERTIYAKIAEVKKKYME
jgi:hypothetical protein